MAKKSETTGQKQPAIEYTLNLKSGGEFIVRETANAWWLDKQKVSNLLTGLEFGCTVQECCDLADITLRKYKYFVRQHPETKAIRKNAHASSILRARASIRKSLEDPKWAYKFLKNKVPSEFGDIDMQAKIQAAVTINMGKIKEEVKDVLGARKVANDFKLNVPGLTDNDDPLPWDSINHKKELGRLLEEIRLGIVQKIDEARVERKPYTEEEQREFNLKANANPAYIHAQA